MDEVIVSSSDLPSEKDKVPINSQIMDATDKTHQTLNISDTDVDSFMALGHEQREEKSKTDPHLNQPSKEEIATFERSQKPASESMVTDWHEAQGHVDSAKFPDTVVTNLMSSPRRDHIIKALQPMSLVANEKNTLQSLEIAVEAKKKAYHASAQSTSRLSTIQEIENYAVSESELRWKREVEGIPSLTNQTTENSQQNHRDSNVLNVYLPISKAAYIVLTREVGKSSSMECDVKGEHRIGPRREYKDKIHSHAMGNKPRFQEFSFTRTKQTAHAATSSTSNQTDVNWCIGDTEENLQESQFGTREIQAETKLPLEVQSKNGTKLDPTESSATDTEPPKIRSLDLQLTGDFTTNHKISLKERQHSSIESGVALIQSHEPQESTRERNGLATTESNRADERSFQEELTEKIHECHLLVSGEHFEISKPDEDVATDLPTTVLDEIEDQNPTKEKRKLPFVDSETGPQAKRKCKEQKTPSSPSFIGTFSTPEKLNAREMQTLLKRARTSTVDNATCSEKMNNLLPVLCRIGDSETRKSADENFLPDKSNNKQLQLVSSSGDEQCQSSQTNPRLSHKERGDFPHPIHEEYFQILLPHKITSQPHAVFPSEIETQPILNKGLIIPQNINVLNTVLGADFKGPLNVDDLSDVILKGMPCSTRVLVGAQPNPPWLMVSHDTLNCWPCLLLRGPHIVWSVPTDSELGKITEEVKRHECDISHISANFTFVMAETKLKREEKAKIAKYEEEKRKNQDLLRVLTRITCFNRKNINNQEESIQLMNLACDNLTELKDFIPKNPPDFLEDFVKSNVPHILEAIEHLMVRKIKENVDKSPFVSMILEEMSDVADKSSIATILRYVAEDGTLTERLVKMSKTGSTGRTAAYLLKIASSVIEEYDLEEKLAGFTYNGTAIHPKETRIFNRMMNRVYTKARHFYYQEHNFKRLITQALTHTPECRDFFYTVGELAEFIERDPNAVAKLIAIDGMGCGKEETHWDLSGNFISTLENHYDSFMDFFNHVLDDKCNWDVAVVAQVEYFRGFFRSHKSQMLLRTTSEILNVVDKLSAAVGVKVDLETWETFSKEAQTELGRMKNSGIQAILQRGRLKIDLKEGSPESTTFTQLFNQLIEATSSAITDRLSSEHYVGLPRLDAIHQDEHLKSYLRRIDEPHNFDKLQIQVLFFYTNPSFGNKTFEESIKYIRESKMVDALSELYKMLQFTLTVPAKTTDSPKGSPAVFRLHSYYSSHKKPLKFLDLLFCMEKDIAKTLEQEEEIDYIVRRCMDK